MLPYSGLLLRVQIFATLKKLPLAEISTIAKFTRQDHPW